MRLYLPFFQKSILDGYLFIKNQKLIFYPLMLILGIQVSLSMIVVSLPAISEQILKVSVNYAGLLVVIPAGIGATLGSIMVSRFLKRGFRKRTVIEYSLFVVAASIMMLMILPLYMSPILLIAAGAGFFGINIPTLTFLQEITPIDFRGRVFGNLWFLVTIVTIFPVLFSGFITEFFGVRTLLTIMSLGILSAFSYVRRWQMQ